MTCHLPEGKPGYPGRQAGPMRLEMFGDLHEYGAPGRVVTRSEALAAV